MMEEIIELEKSEELVSSHRIISLSVPKGETPERIDQYLARVIANTSRSKVQEALEADAVSVNGKILTRGSYKIKGGDEIELRIPSRGRMKAQAEEIPLDIIFEDEEMIVINKPAGMVVHPTLATNSGTLVNALLHHIKNFADEADDEDRPGIVHRLDK